MALQICVEGGQSWSSECYILEPKRESSIVREAQASDSERHGFSLGFGNLLGVCPWFNLFASLSLSFLNYKMKIVILGLQGWV